MKRMPRCDLAGGSKTDAPLRNSHPAGGRTSESRRDASTAAAPPPPVGSGSAAAEPRPALIPLPPPLILRLDFGAAGGCNRGRWCLRPGGSSSFGPPGIRRTSAARPRLRGRTSPGGRAAPQRRRRDRGRGTVRGGRSVVNGSRSLRRDGEGEPRGPAAETGGRR